MVKFTMCASRRRLFPVSASPGVVGFPQVPVPVESITGRPNARRSHSRPKVDNLAIRRKNSGKDLILPIALFFMPWYNEIVETVLDTATGGFL